MASGFGCIPVASQVFGVGCPAGSTLSGNSCVGPPVYVDGIAFRVSTPRACVSRTAKLPVSVKTTAKGAKRIRAVTYYVDGKRRLSTRRRPSFRAALTIKKLKHGTHYVTAKIAYTNGKRAALRGPFKVC